MISPWSNPIANFDLRWTTYDIVTIGLPARRLLNEQCSGLDHSIRFLSVEPLIGPVGKLNLTGIDWVIVGGESGPHARPMQSRWAIEVRNQCLKAKVAFFFKQWGGRSPKSGGRLLEGKEWSQFPATLPASARQLELLARA
jgi:protein gp37